MNYKLPERFFTSTVKIAIIGLGGNGASALSSACDMNTSLKNLGHPKGLSIDCYDADCISPTNIVRQPFYASEIGKKKSTTLVNRFNLFLGESMRDFPRHFDVRQDDPRQYDIILSCTDSGRFRYDLCRYHEDTYCDTMILDLGNSDVSGQFLWSHLSRNGKEKLRLPNVWNLFGEQLLAGDKDNTPSCSVEQALKSQSLFINKTVVSHASAYLWSLLMGETVDFHGAFIDVGTSSVNPIKISHNTWKVFGYEPEKESEVELRIA